MYSYYPSSYTACIQPMWLNVLRRAFKRPLPPKAVVQSTPVTALRGGDSIGLSAKTYSHFSGTLGYFFKDSSNKRGVITSAHVVRKKGLIAISPSKSYKGTINNRIGKVTKREITKRTDGAFVQLDDQTTPTTYQLKNGVRVSGVGKAALDDDVMYYGAETGGVVKGRVTALDWSGKFRSGYTFKDQIQISATNGIQGDSGSLLVRSKDKRALGVMMATLTDLSTGKIVGSVHNDITYFQNDLGITLLV